MIISMISVEFGEYRFFSGDNVTYTDSSYAYLLEQAATAEIPDMKRYAAAGLMRGLVDLPAQVRQGQEFFDAVNWGMGVTLAALEDTTPQEPSPTTRTFLDSLPPVNGVFDATSIAATNTALRDVHTKTTRAAIELRSPSDQPKLFIALGHGGILASLATFAEMPEGTLIYPVRYSRHKAADDIPNLSDEERELLLAFSQDRDVIVHDEDRGFTGTIHFATKYFKTELLRPTFGVTPSTGRHPKTYEPQVLWYKENDNTLQEDTYGCFSDKLEALRRSIEQPAA